MMLLKSHLLAASRPGADTSQKARVEPQHQVQTVESSLLQKSYFGAMALLSWCSEDHQLTRQVFGLHPIKAVDVSVGFQH